MKTIIEDNNPIVIAYLFLFLMSFIIKLNIDTLWEKIDKDDKPPREPWHPQLIGIAELIMYVTSHIIDQPQFIFAWIAVKTVPKIKYWEDKRTLFNIFLIGNAFTIITSYVCYQMYILISSNRASDAILLGWLLGVSLIVIWMKSYSLKKLKL